jgi:hypothetical protein
MKVYETRENTRCPPYVEGVSRGTGPPIDLLWHKAPKKDIRVTDYPRKGNGTGHITIPFT